MTTTAADRAYSHRLSWLAIVGTLLAGLGLILFRPSGVPLANAIPAVILVFAGMVPTIIYLRGPKTDQMPLLPLFGASFAFCYGVTVFSDDKTRGYIPSNLVDPNSIAIALLGLFLFYAGYIFSRVIFAPHIRPIRLPFDGAQPGCRLLIWALVPVHLILAMVAGLHNMGSISQLMNPTGFISFGMLYILWQEGRLSRLERFLFFWCCIPLELLWRFSSGALATVIFLGVFFQVVYWRQNRRIPWAIVIGTAAFFLFLQPVKFEFRNQTYRHGRYANLGTIGRAKLFASLTYRYYTGQITKEGQTLHDPVVSRAADIRVLALTLRQTPVPVGFWKGHSLSLLITNLVPRVLWPEKPRELIGQEFGHRYHLIADWDYDTTINLPWMVEFYVNFGIPGLIIGMLTSGAAFAMLQQKFAASGMNSLSFVVGAAILFRFTIDQDSNLSMVVGAMLSLTISLSLYFHIAYWLLNPSRPTLVLRPRLAGD